MWVASAASSTSRRAARTVRSWRAPRTAAASTTARAAGASASRRAATARASASGAGPSARVGRADGCSSAWSTCSTNSGLPSVTAWTCAARPASPTSAATSATSRPASGTSRPKRRSASRCSSWRAAAEARTVPTRSSGWSCRCRATNRARSREGSSARCRSSRTTRSGRRAACSRSSWATASKSSIRSAPAGSSRTCSPRVRAPPRPRSSRTTWIHGQYGGATASSPQYAQHTVNPCARAVELSSRARRVLPIPAGPVRSRTGPGGCGASRSAATRAPSCRSRPTKRRISTSAGGSASGSRPPEPWWGDDMVRATVVGGPDRPEPAPVDPVRGDAGAQGGGAGLVSGRGWSAVGAGQWSSQATSPSG